VKTFGFTAQVRRIDVEDEGQMRALENLPFEASAGGSNGQTLIDIVIDEDRAATAARTSIRGLAAIGIDIERFDLDLVTTTDIASRCNTHRESVRLWSTGQRRENFPTAYSAAGGSALWRWADVYEWLQLQSIEIDDLYGDTPLPSDLVERLNGNFARDRELTHNWGTPVHGVSLNNSWGSRRVVAGTAWSEPLRQAQ
jgi:hypothetical protein